MDPVEARAVLGVTREASAVEVRAAYRRALRRHHPDVGGTAGATTAAVEAYRVLRGDVALDAPDPAAAPTAAPVPASVVVDGDTVSAELPAGDLFALLIEAADGLGEIAYADADAGLLELVVDVDGDGACSVVLNLQGRGSGLTEAWCTVERLAGGPPPAAGVVAELLAAGLRRISV